MQEIQEIKLVSLIQAIKNIDIHDHICSIYETGEEQFAAAVPFIKFGIERNEKCIYIAGENSIETVREALSKEISDISELISSGALAIIDKDKSYVKPGYFDAKWVMDFLKEQVLKAKRDGYNTLRVTGEASWVLVNDVVCQQFVDYESAVNTVLSEMEIVALCQYNRKLFKAEVIKNVIETHPRLICNGTLCNNYYYIPPEEYIGRNNPEEEINRMLKQLLETENNIQELREKNIALDHANSQLSNEIETRKKIDSELKQSEERYKKLVEVSPDVIVIHSEDRIEYMNKAGITLYGAESLDEITQKTIVDFIHPEDREKVFSIIGEVMRSSGRNEFVEIKYVKKNGDTVELEVIGVPTTYNGKPALQIVGRNIEERKRAEDILKLSEAKFRTLFESSPIAVGISISGITFMANPAYLKMFGLAKIEEVYGQPLLNQIAPEFREQMLEQMLDRTQRRERGENIPMQFEALGIRKNGEVFPFEAHVTYVDFPEGQTVVAFITDISELKRSEESMKASLKEKEILLKEIHHRVKNNLQIITSLLSLQSDYLEDERSLHLFHDSESRIRTMAMIHENLYHSSDLSGIDFSDYIPELVNYLCNVYNKGYGNINVREDIEHIFMSIDSAIPCGLIINELISNALKYALVDGNGELFISFHKVNSGQNYQLIVADKGPGLPEDLDHRESNSLGLILVNSLVSQLNGTICYENSGGAKFTINFPHRN